MQTYSPTSTVNPADLPARLTIGVGRPGNELLFEADPLLSGIRVVAYGGVDLEFDGDDFDVIADLLQRSLGN